MNIIQLPSTKNYPKRLSVQKWTIISITLQVALLFILLVNDWILNLKQSLPGQDTSYLNKFLVYSAIVLIFQIFIFKFRKTYLLGLIFYVIWITVQSFNLFEVTTRYAKISEILILLFSIIVLATMIVVYYKHRILNKNKKKDII